MTGYKKVRQWRDQRVLFSLIKSSGEVHPSVCRRGQSDGGYQRQISISASHSHTAARSPAVWEAQKTQSGAPSPNIQIQSEIL